MIHWVQIIHDSRICLHFCNYSDQKVNKDLSSGLMSAILGLAKEVHQETIKEIHMESNYIFYGVREPIIMAVSTTEAIKKKKLTYALDCILNLFFDNYSTHLQHNILDPDTFTSFSSTIEDEFVKNGLITRYFGKEINRGQARKSLLEL